MSMKLNAMVAIAGISVLASCGADGRFDPDLRGLMRGGLDTAAAASRAAPRPDPDARGVISYPGYQVAVARQGDTVATVAARLGLNAAELAQYNAIAGDAPLDAGAIIALPRRVAPTVAQQPARQAATTAPPSAAQPRQHVVAAGETVWSIARKYDVPATDLASWNGLPAAMTLRVGQRLLIPVAGAPRPAGAAAVSAPGVGSPTPQPPSASRPLPDEKTAPAASPAPKAPTPDLGATRTAASGTGRFRMPVDGAIIRTYEKGKNDGIDISAPPGAAVRAAGAGRIAAITRDTEGVPIVVVRHDGDLMTVYAGLDGLTVAKGDSVTAGQSMGRSTNTGVVHFEVRRGFESMDPENYL